MTFDSERADDRLDSWKQIAAYLRRGIRTVRRWERQEGLPVHRHVHRVLGSVYAFKSEIDAWQTRERERTTAREVVGDSARRDASVRRSIAVLPFANLSADADNAYFADGLTDEVTADLSKLRSLRVISRTSAATFRGVTKDAKSIARELGARYLLEGSVRRMDNRLRITAQLVDADSDVQLWAEKFDGTIEDVFAIQERIARTIVAALQVRLTTDEDQRLGARAIDDVHAYECYLRARQQGWRWRKDAIDQAIQLLRNGLSLVGDNARLYTALGIAHLQYREAGIDVTDRPLDEAEACARKVFELDPNSAGGFQLRGWINYARGNVQEAVRDLKWALDAEPNDADTLLLLSNCYLISGQVSAARPLLEALSAIDPLTPLTRCMPAYAEILEGDFAAAIEPYRAMFEMDPGNPMSRLFLAWVLILNGRLTEARELVASFPAEVRDTLPARVARFLVDASAEHDGPLAAPSLTPEMEAAAAVTDVFPRMLAGAYALSGKNDAAMHWLEIAVNRGFINHSFLARLDPTLSGLRNDPGFGVLMNSVRQRWERFQA